MVAILPQPARVQRAGELLDRVAAAYRRYDNAAGARMKVGQTGPSFRTPLHCTRPGPASSANAASWASGRWRPCGTRQARRTRRRSCSDPDRGSSFPRRETYVREGAYAGDTLFESPGKVHLPPDLLRRHHLYVARTRMGKSTLMRHFVAHRMREKAEGRDGGHNGRSLADPFGLLERYGRTPSEPKPQAGPGLLVVACGERHPGWNCEPELERQPRDVALAGRDFGLGSFALRERPDPDGP